MRNLIDVTKLPEAPYKPLADFARKVAAEGCVLLKNEGNILPIAKDDSISLFGRTQIEYHKSGIGSGGLVRVDYSVNILDGIRKNPKLTLNEDLVKVYQKWIEENPAVTGLNWDKMPWYQPEMVPDEEIVADARRKSDIAVIVLGRIAGEGRDNSADKGSWYLTDDEESLLEIVSRYFEKTVVLLNVGNIIDMKWVEKYNIKSVMYVWQGGQEGGNAVADVLCGDVTPCGKLTDTIARDISLYPGTENFGNADCNIYVEDIYVGYRYFETYAKDEVLYPFGFGLSYTEFENKLLSVDHDDGIIKIDVEVKNIGNFTGREIIQVYFEAPQGLLGKSARELCAFQKTKLLSVGEKQQLHMEVAAKDMCAYDDSGITGNKACFVLEAGDYNIYVGSCVRSAEKVFTYSVAETTVVKECNEVMAPVREFQIMHPIEKNGKYELSYKAVSKRTVDYDRLIKENLPKDLQQTGDRGIKLIDVKNGKNTIEEFVAQLSNDDLMCLMRGEGMCSPKARPGNAGVIGGVTESLSKFGIPIIALHDGPSGIRMDSGEHATSLPNGTCIACTWDTELAEELYSLLSIELCTHSIDSILGPGINIHRLPLNGRNFEYFSEDPYVSGKMGAALVRGIADYRNSATIKHFAANSQEFCRRDVDSVVSERALREIYLKSFELAVVEGRPTSLMTSYNPINGIWSANNYELNTVILREEWGYDGFVMTDWWPKLSEGESECINLKNLVEAQNDVYMPTADAMSHNDNLEEALRRGEITRGQLQRNAINTLKYLLNSRTLERFIENGESIKKSLVDSVDRLHKIKEIVMLESDKEYEVPIETPDRYLICVEYSSEESSISQMTLNLKVDGKSATSATVNGTSGKKQMLYRDISFTTPTPKISISYPDNLLAITKIEIRY